jgi:type IV secretory pathway TraG/TraD family ATPase VirD4
MQPTRRRPLPPAQAGDFLDEILPWMVAALMGWALIVWAGGAVALLAAGGNLDGLTLGAAMRAMFTVLGRVGDPASAWPDDVAGRLPGAGWYWLAQAAVVASAVVVGLVAVRLWRRVGQGGIGPLGVRGEAGFARRTDLGRLAVEAPVPSRLTLGFGGGRLLAAEPQASLAVVGPTGCGKTAGFVIPALLEWRGPVIATSVKNDLLDATVKHRRRRGRVWVYDPTSCSGQPAAAWSPLAGCGTWNGAMRMAAWMAEAAQPRVDSVSDGDYWYSQARKGLAPYLHAAAATGRSLADVVRWVDTQDVDEVERALRQAADRAVLPEPAADSVDEGGRWEELWGATVAMTADLMRAKGGDAGFTTEPVERWPRWAIDQITELVDVEWRSEITAATRSLSEDPLAPLTAAKALWGKEPRLRGSVLATMENILSGWSDPGVVAAAEACDIDLDAWLAGDNTLYVIATAHEQARLRPVLATLVQQAVRRAYDTAALAGGRLRHPCLVLLDEAGNIAPLRDLPGYASTARSHGITLVSVWQDLAQVKAVYRDRAQTVLNNHRARLFGTGIADRDTLEYVSGLIGEERRTERNVSADVHGGRRTVSEYRTYRRAAPVDVLRRVRPAEAVLLYGSELPVHLRLRPWFADRLLQATAAGAQPVENRGRRRARLRR